MYQDFITWQMREPGRHMTQYNVAMQELGDTAPFVNGSESGLKRRCIVMLELSATLARVLEFLTSKLPDLFLSGPPLNLSRYKLLLLCTRIMSLKNAWSKCYAEMELLISAEMQADVQVHLCIAYCDPVWWPREWGKWADSDAHTCVVRHDSLMTAV